MIVVSQPVTQVEVIANNQTVNVSAMAVNTVDVSTPQTIVNVDTPAPIEVVVSPVGLQGATGSGIAQAGPGFRVVGNELRYDFASLTRG